MMRWQMMFCKIISLFCFSLLPIDQKLALVNTFTDPIKTHVHSLGSFLFDAVIANAGGSAVVSLDWSRGLRVSEFFKTYAQRSGFFSIVEAASKFGFRCAGEYLAHDLGRNVNGAIVRWFWICGQWWLHGISGLVAQVVVPGIP